MDSPYGSTHVAQLMDFLLKLAVACAQYLATKDANTPTPFQSFTELLPKVEPIVNACVFESPKPPAVISAAVDSFAPETLQNFGFLQTVVFDPNPSDPTKPVFSYTFGGVEVSRLGKRDIITKSPFLADDRRCFRQCTRCGALAHEQTVADAAWMKRWESECPLCNGRWMLKSGQ